MAKHQKVTADLDPQRLTAEAIHGIDEFVQEFAGRESNFVGAGLSCWSEEIQLYFSGLSKQTRKTIDQLKTCQTPFDVLKVEQQWWSARTRAYLESGVRFAQAFSDAAKNVHTGRADAAR